MALDLLRRRTWASGGYTDYLAVCPTCGRNYVVTGRHCAGGAEFVTVVCGPCETNLGVIREDIGGDKRLESSDAI